MNLPHPFVVFGREVLGEVINNVLGFLLPLEAELVLLGASSHPVETHVKSFGVLPVHVSSEYVV